MNLIEPNNNQMELEFAGQMVERHDVQAPGLLETTGGGYGMQTGAMASVSGLNDYDYQNLSTLSMGMKQLNQIVTTNKIPIPPEIMDHFKHMKCNCMMGLFPEIGRAWLTIDSDIYIWTYEDERDVAYYDGLNHAIVSVALVVPKPGVFVSDVKHLLVVTTPMEIVVLGVTFGDSTKTVCSPNKSLQNSTPYVEMQLMNKPIFVLNTDNVSIASIEGTTDGRIFLGGRDGALYELQYQAESNWFGKRCRKVNHSQSLMSLVVPGFLKVFSDTDAVAKLTVDNSRGLMYVLYEKGGIEVWEMEANGGARSVARLSPKEITQIASNALKSTDPNIFKHVTAVCALEQEDNASAAHLMAVTECGVRFYFTTTTSAGQQYPQMMMMTTNNPQMTSNDNLNPEQQQQQQMNGQQKATGLYLLHVRLPPGYTPNTTVGKPRQVHTAFYHRGTSLMVSTPQPDQDMLWSLSSEPFPMSGHFAESSTILPLDGQVWAVGRIKDKQARNVTLSTLKNTQQPTKIAILTNHGIHMISLLKPVDLLQQLLLACHGPHHDAVKAYFQVQKEHEACATSLLLACWEQLRGSEIATWAAQAFFIYGGEPTIAGPQQGQMMAQMNRNNSNLTASSTMIQNQSGFMDQNSAMGFASTPYAGMRAASAIQQSLFQQTRVASPGSPGMSSTSVAASEQNVLYSAKHTGLYLHVMRALKPVWRRRCLLSKSGQVFSSITYQDCAQVLDDLNAVKQFLIEHSVANLNSSGNHNSSTMYHNHSTINQNHSTFVDAHSTLGGFQSPMSQMAPQSMNSMMAQYGSVNNQRAMSAMEEARMEEKRSLDALSRFIKHTCEVMALWKILCEHQFHVLIGALPKEQQSVLINCTFRDLILLRADTCFQLIIALINFYLNDNASVGSISSKLRDVCPSLYSNEDAVSHKATEIMLLSKSVADVEEKQDRLQTALRLYKSAAPNLPLANICQQFTGLGYYQGVIDLIETCAAKFDPNETGLQFYKAGEEQDDPEGLMAYSTRLECYKQVKVMLDQVYQGSRAVVTGSGDQNSNGVGGGNSNNNVAIEKANRDISNIVSLTLQSRDYLLHNAVYEWLLSHQMLGELLGIGEPSLGQFLNNSVNKCPEDQQLADLLWKYHERNGQHLAAAKILDQLATMESNRIGLTQRIEYLGKAVMCMRSDAVGYCAHNGALLKDLEDKLEIAQVQKFTHSALASLQGAQQNQQIQEAVRQLNSSLFTMTDLYTKFAECFDLWECKLKILNASHHNDPLLIELVWTKILEQELERAGGGSPYEKMCRLLAKVESLSREYSQPGHCFPLAYLVRELELHSCHFRLEESPVPESLLQRMTLDPDAILDIYSRMISMNERVWFAQGNEWHLVQSTHNVVAILAGQPTLVSVKHRRRIIAKAQELVSACLNLLYTKPDTQNLIDKLRALTAKLQRIAN